MTEVLKFGKGVFAAAMLGFSALLLSFTALGSGPKPGPPWISGLTVLSFLTGAVLLFAGLSLIVGKKDEWGAALLAVVLFLYVLAYYFPRIIANPHNFAPWTSGFELLALCGIVLIFCAPTLVGSAYTDSLDTTGRIFFAASLVVFGIQHFIYAEFVATLVPAWIPARLFWAYFVGVAFCAAALSIVTRIQARLAATLLGLMFLIWVPILHAPRVLHTSQNGNEWTSLLVALAMGGGSWIIAAAESVPSVRPEFQRNA